MKKKIVLVIKCLLVVAVFFLNACSMSSTEPTKKALNLFQNGKKAYLKKELKSALIFFKQAVEEQSDFVNARVMLGKTQYFLGKIKDSEKTLKKSVKIAKYHVEALYYLARISLMKKNISYAVKCLENILEVDPNNARANYSLGTIYASQKNYKKAFYNFNKALEEEAMLARVRYTYADKLVKSGLKKRAKTILKPAIEYKTHGKLKKDIKKLWAKIKK